MAIQRDSDISEYFTICECGHERVDHWRWQSELDPTYILQRCNGCSLQLIDAKKSKICLPFSIQRDHVFVEDFGSVVERMRREKN